MGFKLFVATLASAVLGGCSSGDTGSPSKTGDASTADGCLTTTCAARGFSCGTTDDGCGATLTCGNCRAPQTCGGGGVANVCDAPAANSGWTNVIDDEFDTGGVPDHWHLYDAQYGSAPYTWATPSHVTVSGGAMHMLMSYETSGSGGANWYTAGMMIDAAYGSIDQRITVRFRIVNNGVSGHRIIPMSFPDGYPWPQGGEEDYCEGEESASCDTYLHYGDTPSTQIYHTYTFDLSQWHVFRIERKSHVITAYIDDLVNPTWTYMGSSTTIPDTIKRAVLQQECPASGCPSGTTGTEDIQIDWITIDNPL